MPNLNRKWIIPEISYLGYCSRGFFFAPETELPEDAGALLPASASFLQQILAIEDNPGLQFFLKKKLGGAYQAVVAADGRDGLQKAFSLTPDLIICDIMLPGMNGLELARTLKAGLRTSYSSRSRSAGGCMCRTRDIIDNTGVDGRYFQSAFRSRRAAPSWRRPSPCPIRSLVKPPCILSWQNRACWNWPSFPQWASWFSRRRRNWRNLAF